MASYGPSRFAQAPQESVQDLSEQHAEGLRHGPSGAGPASAAARHSPSLASRALRVLTRREHSRSELQRKLAVHAENEQQLEQVLDAMQAKGFLSDTRAAESVARQKSARFGNARIQQELKAKGIDKELISSTLATLEDSEAERAKAVWSAKFGHVDLHELPWSERQKAQAKQLRFMLSRGFSMAHVRKLMDGTDSE